MIVREFYSERTDGVKLYRTYSDAGLYIRQEDTGGVYREAVDVEDTLHTYEETAVAIEIYEEIEEYIPDTTEVVVEE